MSEKNKSVVIIEARMTSSRLPGKVLMESCGKPLLQHMIERIRRSKKVNDIVVATTVKIEDNPIVELCKKTACNYYRGSELDVLDRVVGAAKSVLADVVIEICGDCPLVDWRHIDYLLGVYETGDYDFVSNNIVRSFPIGFDVRIFSTALIDSLNKDSENPLDHEHVSIHFPNHPEKYKCFNWHASDSEDRPDIEVTLDEMDDYIAINSIYEGIYPINNDFSCKDVIDFVDCHQDIMKHVKRTVINYDG